MFINLVLSRRKLFFHSSTGLHTFIDKIVERSDVEVSHSAFCLLGESNFVGELEQPQLCGRYVDYQTFIFATVTTIIIVVVITVVSI